MDLVSWGIAFAFVVGLITAIVRLKKYFDSKKKEIQQNRPNGVVQTESLVEGGPPVPHGISSDNLLTKISIVATLLMGLTIVSATGFHLYGDPPRPSLPLTMPSYLLEAFNIAIVVGLISFPISDSILKLVENILLFTIPLLTLIWLIVSPSLLPFSATCIVIGIIVIAELKQLIYADFLVSVSQFGLVFALFASVLLIVGNMYVPDLVSYRLLGNVIPFLRFRAIAASSFGAVIVTVLCFRTYQSFSYQAKDLIAIDSDGDKNSLISAVKRSINLLVKVSATIGAFVEAFGRELISFLRQVLSRAVWMAILYATGTIVCLLALAAEVSLIKPHLFNVMQNVSLIFNPSWALAFSNLCFGAAFIVALIATQGLVQLWLPRSVSREARLAAETQVVNGSAMVCFCIWLANVLYYPFLNSFFTLGDQRLSVPGVYTLLIVVFAIVSMVRHAMEKRRLPDVSGKSKAML